MIGKHPFKIDAEEFAKGMSSTDHISDGGFSDKTTQVNPAITPGVLYAPASAVDSDTDIRLTGNIIAMSNDMVVFNGTEKLAITDDGKAYRYNGTKLTAAGIALTATRTWATGFTDIITYAGEAYVTSKESITRWQNDNTIDADAAWPHAFTNTAYPHPALVYENNAFYGDKNLLWRQTAVASAPTVVLTLSAEQVIIALEIDPGTGYMLISTTNSLNISNTLPSISKLLWYDGFSDKPLKSAIVDDLITSFHANSGNVFVCYGNKFGYLNGAGITFLRTLKNVTMDSSLLVFKHKITSIRNTIFIADGSRVLAYGEVLPGRKVFWPAYQNSISGTPTTIGALADVGNGKLGFAYATSKFYTLNTGSTASMTSTASIDYYTNKIHFPRPVFIRSAFVETVGSVGNNAAPGTLSMYDESQTQTTFSTLTNGTGSVIYSQETKNLDKKVRTAQFYFSFSGQNYGIRRIVIFYDIAE